MARITPIRPDAPDVLSALVREREQWAPEPDAVEVEVACGTRDATAALIAEWRAPVLPEAVLELEARLYEMSGLRAAVPFVAWLIVRGYRGGHE